MPGELREQVPVMKDVLQAMGVNVVSKEGYEADDILGTLAKKSEAQDMDVTILSGDRDLLQLATDHICIRIPKTKGGKITFQVQRCLYYDISHKFGCPELCPVFFEYEHIAFKGLGPKIVCSRAGELATGHEVCDFCFKKGK